jgi:hypothetical protein
MPLNRKATKVGPPVFGGQPSIQHDQWEIKSPLAKKEKPVVKNSFLSAVLARTQKSKEIIAFTDAQRLADDDSLKPPSLGSKENISGAKTPKPSTMRP